ncbi:MarR family transcriptional regulator [Kordiimonas sediminis]|uniref:MarR family transcriptional regulator n=1 Tax=Kordiimonas sediminis TaxID=1735581 RepID=A0A919AKF6_9PROT|nr:MarR family transcriptional regulator [Kordiimonas sediminis]GHF12740.1 MarR family transcriptional regulator [Kordiimonas sediminis]
MSEKTNPKMLRLWREAMLSDVRSSHPDLTMRQMSVLLSVYMTEPPHTVRGLAKELKVTKPVITRALDTLGKLDLLKRLPDENDKRSITVARTVKGAVFLSELSDILVEAERRLDAEDA